LTKQEYKKLEREKLKQMHLIGHTALWDMSKVLEVTPITLTDLTEFILSEFHVKEIEVLQAEQELRGATGYENEVATTFDFLIWYMKAWRLKSMWEFEKIKVGLDYVCYDEIFNFFTTFEQIGYDFSKAMLLDAEILEFKPSIMMAGVISVAIELYLKTKVFGTGEKKMSSVILNEMLICNMVWEQLIEYLFGERSVKHIDRFGHYITLRAQLLYY